MSKELKRTEDLLKEVSGRGLDAVKEKILQITKGKPSYSLLDLCREIDASVKDIDDAVEELEIEGFDIEIDKDAVVRTFVPPPGFEQHLFNRVKKGGTLKIGAISDTHYGNVSCRQDVINAAYDHFDDEKITSVYHAGNLIDGYHKVFNHNELADGCFDLEGQLEYAALHHPKKKGITTYYIAAEDHEGWWHRKDNLNIGRIMQNYFHHSFDRRDLKCIGFGECDIELRIPGMKLETRGPIMRVVHPGGGTAYALSYKTQKMVECVPISSQALTKDGWETYHNLKVGDEILGYNQETGQCEWTELKVINRYEQSPIQHWKNDMFEVHCTPEHKWAMEWESRGGKNPNSIEPKNYVRTDKVLWTIEEAKDRARIIQAAPGPEGSGWEPKRHELLSRQKTVQNVLKMASGQRLAFIHGMLEGEGTWTGAGGTLQFSQALGPVLDAFQLACFLEGIATSPKVREDNRKESYKTTCKATLLKSNKRMVNSMRLLDEYEDTVWCPTTALGTWVMKQGQVVTITGNSLQGGEKPQLILCGHYHKFDWNYHREVNSVMVGCLEDQTMFMRKNNIPAHLGYCIIEMTISPTEGTLEAVKVQWVPWYDRQFYTTWTKRQKIDSE